MSSSGRFIVGAAWVATLWNAVAVLTEPAVHLNTMIITLAALTCLAGMVTFSQVTIAQQQRLISNLERRR